MRHKSAQFKPDEKELSAIGVTHDSSFRLRSPNGKACLAVIFYEEHVPKDIGGAHMGIIALSPKMPNLFDKR
jgi:hypothetical protein